MTIVAFVSDIHANIDALTAVEADASALGVEHWFCCGDVVGLGPSPSEVVTWLAALEVPCVLGNVDHNILRILRRQDRYRESSKYAKWISYGWTWNALTGEDRLFLSAAKKKIRRSLFGEPALLVHGLPGQIDGFLTEAMARDDGKRLLKKQRCSLLVAGHSHRAFVHHTKRGTLINCGSVGLALGGDPKATYVVGRFEPGELPAFEIRQISYDVDRLCRRFSEAGLPEVLARPFREARWLTEAEVKSLEPFLKNEAFVARGGKTP